jgi:hypothetical protein
VVVEVVEEPIQQHLVFIMVEVRCMVVVEVVVVVELMLIVLLYLNHLMEV